MIDYVSKTKQIGDTNLSDVFQVKKKRLRLLHGSLRVQELRSDLVIGIVEVLNGFQEVHNTFYRRFSTMRLW